VTKRMLLIGMLVLALGLLAGCGGSAATETVSADAVPVVAPDAGNTVVAEAVIEPARWSELRFDSAGTLVEVLVQGGDSVSAGDALARQDTALLELSLAEAQANVALQRAVLAQLAATRPTSRTVELELRQARAQSSAPGIAIAEAELAQAQITLDNARTEYQKALDRPWEPDSVREAYAETLQRAELAYQAAEARLEQARLAQSAHYYGVELQEITLQQALAEWEQQAAQAEARLQQAEVAVQRIQLQIEEATLRASFDGTVAAVNVEVGDTVSPGETVLVLATLDRLQARTTDLTELDVVRVAEEQSATVTVDALPGQEFTGVVREIALQPGNYRGDVVYDVIVELTDAEGFGALRWGMTAMVEVKPP